MRARPGDLEPFEQEWLAGADDVVETARTARSGCPTAAVLSAARARALPVETQAVVDDHVRGCRLCQLLATDLETVTSEQNLSELDQHRIWMTIRAASNGGTRWQRVVRTVGSWPLLASAAAALLVAIVLWPTQRHAPVTDGPRPRTEEPPRKPLATQPPVTPSATAAIAVAPAGVRLAVGSLTVRGGSGQAGYLDDLAPAFEAYRAGRFGDAASKFESLAARYPRSIEPEFYLGVSRLLSQDAVGAVLALQDCAAMKDEGFDEDANWYLAVALHRTGQVDRAATLMRSLCQRRGARASEACDALAIIEGSTTPPTE